ncbi:MAG: hypothetical protein R3253_06300 [Longimicrobiales bacterium]|nr:hypothetical protein [Longimicrobiales bacterium]
MTVASRGVTLRDFAIFQAKLFLDGMKDFLAIWLSVGAIILDFIAGRGSRPRLFYSVVRASERFDRWINLHGVLDEMDAGDTADGLFGGSRAGDGTFVGRIEKMVRGGDEPTARRSSEGGEDRSGPS